MKARTWMLCMSALGFLVPISQGREHRKGQLLRLKEYVGREWPDELIHYDLTFRRGEYPGGSLKLFDQAGKELPVQLAGVRTHDDGSLKSARVWLVTTLRPKAVQEWRLAPGVCAAVSDLRLVRKGKVLKVTTARTGAEFRLGERTFKTPVAAAEVPSYLSAIRQRSGTWGGRGWFETPHKCRSYKVWIMERGPVYVKVGFEYRFDGFRGEGKDIYKGHVRIAARQELIEFVEDYSLGDPKVYRIWQPKSRAEEIMWDWWQWRPHEARHNFCFSIYDGLKPTKARWYGHNSTIPEKRTGRNPGMDFETDYKLDYSQDRFDIAVTSYHRGCPDQALSYMAWREADPRSDAVAVIGIRPTEWQHADMVPHLMKTIVHHTDTACVRIHALKKPDLVVKAPLHLGKRVWGITTLKMPEAGPTKDERKGGKIVSYAFQQPSLALKLRSKYGNRQLDKVKDWTLEWPSTRTYPSLFVKKGGLEAVLRRIRSSRILLNHARRQTHKPIMRYILDNNARHAQAAYNDLMNWCNRHIDILFNDGYCSHKGTNNNQYPWWMQEMSGRFDLIMGMPEVSQEQKVVLKAYFSFCVHMLQDDDFMPPRSTGVGWGSANMPVNTRGGRAITAAVLADNPDAKVWFDRAVEYVDALVNKVWSEDGSPISGPHYVSTQADPLMNMALPLYYAGALPPIQKKYPRIRNFTRLLIDRLTPPDRRVGNVRILPTIGHTRLEYCANIGKYAMMMNLTDKGRKGLAGQAYWLWKRAGMATHGFMDGIYYMHEEFNENQPQVKSVVYPGSLTFLRHGFPHPNETYMAIHCGNQGFDHYDADVGGFLLYAKGAPLMMDFCSMYVPNCGHSIWHNTLSWNLRENPPRTPCPGRGHPDCWFTKRMWKAHKYKPHMLLDRCDDSQTQAVDGFKEYAGEIRAQALTPEVDYVMAAMPLIEFKHTPYFNKAESENPVPWAPYQDLDRRRLKKRYEWQRRFIFIKDEDLNGPNYFVIQDDLDGQAELTPTANFWCLADDMRVGKDTVRWTGQYEVDLDMYVAYPKRPKLSSRTWWHSSSQPLRVTHKKGREEQIAAHIANAPGKGGFCVVLYPRGRYEVRPFFKSNRDGSAIEVTIGRRRDVIFCSRKQKTTSFGGVKCDGTAAVVKLHPDYSALTLAEPGKLTLKGISLESKSPLAIRIAGKTISGRATGRGRFRLILSPAWAGRKMLVNGKAAGTFDYRGKIEFSLPEGGGTLTVKPGA